MKALPPVMIIAPPADPHALAVLGRLHQFGSYDSFIWDASRIPMDDQLTYKLGSNTPTKATLIRFGEKIDLSTIHAVWYRRFHSPNIPKEVKERAARIHAARETSSMVHGILTSIGVPIVNDHNLEITADNKVRQLCIAKDVGLTVAPTLFSNDEHEVRHFFNELNEQLIFKTYTAKSGDTLITQRLESRHLDRLDLLNRAPVIFQKMIKPGRDVRVTVVGSEVFAGEATSTYLDWRTEPGIRWTATTLSSDIKNRIVELVNRLGLQVASLDFRSTDTGDLVFFEVNPNGQFLFLEIDDPALNISTSLAKLLLSHSKRIS